MATETLEANKTQEPDSPLKAENGVTDSVTVTETKESKGEEAKSKSQVSERPTRERKKTARYITPTSPPSSLTKPASIQQGRGTQLKDIPNVAYKLSKRKPADNLFLLHTILYGKKGKVQMLKRNIGQFSGFVWSEQEEEKQRARVKEKLEKCIKEKLIDFCDVLDIPINKSTVKKDELAVKVLEFLVSPKATRDVVLAESKKETKKRKKSTPKPGESSDVPAKKRRESKKSGKKQDQPSETEDGDVDSKETNDSCGKDDAAPEKVNGDTETKDKKSKAEEKKSTDMKSLSKRTKKEKPAPEEEKSLKGPAKSGRNSSKQVDKSTSSSNKKQKVDYDNSSKEKGKKQTSKPHAKGFKDQGKASNKGKTQPTRKQLHVVVADILKEVDFDTATLSDILRKLGIHFGVDLMHRKNEVKDIITDALDEMSDDDDNGDETTK